MLLATPRRLLPLLFAAAVLTAAAAHAAPSQKSSTNSKSGGIAYRWVDEQGVVHYGDNIPPQYAAEERTVLNREGVAVGHIDGAKTPEQAKADAQAKSVALKQRQHDSFLVSTYTSVKDIEALRDSRLDQMQGQHAAAEQYVESLRARLGALQARALTFRPYNTHADARRMPDDLAENLVRTLDEFRTQSSSLAAKSEEEKNLRAEFDADIERYKQLHTIHSASQ
jgi:hypothetical protein